MGVLICMENFFKYICEPQVCNEDKTFDFAIKVSNGTQQPYVTWKALSDYYFVYPNDETIIDVFCDKTNSVIEMVLKNEKEIQKLTNLRDRLLPLLMNGQVEVEGNGYDRSAF
jgi:type I restriction enzyme S subunit